MSDILKKLGANLAFEERADFSKMSDMDLWISNVFHKAAIETNEKGTEASAVSTVEFGVKSAPPLATKFICDRPFLFFIYDKVDNIILFIGKDANPTK